LFRHKREGNLIICINNDEPGGLYANRHKAGTEIQVLYNIIHMWNLKYSVTEAEGRMLVMLVEKTGDVGQSV
jgi:hypothetical protein